MSEPTRHHYVPIFYLKQWTGSDGKLTEYSRPYREVKTKRKHPSATAYVDNLYSIPQLPEDPQFTEKAVMQKVDDGASRALTAILRRTSAEQLDIRVKTDFSRFLHSLMLRMPEHMKLLQDRISKSHLVEMEMLRPQYAALRRPSDPATFEEYKASFGGPLDIAASELLSISLASGEIAASVANMNWGTFNLRGTKHSLLTSDRPVIAPQGLALSDSYLAFPLSPHVLFVATKTATMPKFLRAKERESIVRVINDAVSSQAIQFVYGMDDSQYRFIENRLGSRVYAGPFG
jgi:hypothetical protein